LHLELPWRYVMGYGEVGGGGSVKWRVVGDHDALGVKHVKSHHRAGSRGTDGKHKMPSDVRFRVFVKGVELVLPNPDHLIIDNSDPHQVVITWGEDDYATAVQDSDRRAKEEGDEFAAT
jgi:hypothetical protein